MAKPSPWRDFDDGDIVPRRHSSTFGDTHQPLATPIAIWRHISRFGDRRSKRWQAGEIKKAKVEALPPYRHPRWLKGLAFSHAQVAAEVFRLAKQKRLSRYRDVISAVLSRFGDPRRPSAIYVTVPQQLSRYGEASTCGMQGIAAHLAVPRPSRNRDFGRDSRRQSCPIGPLYAQYYSGTRSRVCC